MLDSLLANYDTFFGLPILSFILKRNLLQLHLLIAALFKLRRALLRRLLEGFVKVCSVSVLRLGGYFCRISMLHGGLHRRVESMALRRRHNLCHLSWIGYHQSLDVDLF